MSLCRMSLYLCTILWPIIYCIAIVSVVPLCLKAVKKPWSAELPYKHMKGFILRAIIFIFQLHGKHISKIGM